jgi:hypothetical protein
MSNLNEALDKYFAETPREQVLKDWAEFEELDNCGPKLSEFLHQINVLTQKKVKAEEGIKNRIVVSPNTQYPNFNSGIFFNNNL